MPTFWVVMIHRIGHFNQFHREDLTSCKRETADLAGPTQGSPRGTRLRDCLGGCTLNKAASRGDYLGVLSRCRTFAGLFVVLPLGGCLHAKSVEASQTKVDRAFAVHVLNRFAFGPSARDLAAAKDVHAWFEQQLAATSDPVPQAYLASTQPPLQLFEAMAGESMMEAPNGAEEALPLTKKRKKQQNKALSKKLRSLNFKRLSSHYTMAQLVRHVESENQLAEVMTDFWVNHFNVFARKGPVKFYAGHYVEHAIRPHVLGKFEDLLLATAQHPAMLIYLDNQKSKAPLSKTQLARARKAGKRRDLNENYARELLELHTVGTVHDQADVVAAARVLTGWGVAPVIDGGGFRFSGGAHDRGSQTVLGRTFGSGMEEGVRMLRFLARHPATGELLATKLCARFVADDPPAECVSSVAAAHQASKGDISAMLRTIYRSPAFRANRSNKVKTPLEFLVSAMRALDAKPTEAKLANVLYRLGQPELMMPVPTGYPEEAEAWTGTSAMLQRMNVAASFGSGKVPGATVDLDRIMPLDTNSFPEAAVTQLSFEQAGTHTKSALRRETASLRSHQQKRAVSIALVLGSPEFLQQ